MFLNNKFKSCFRNQNAHYLYAKIFNAKNAYSLKILLLISNNGMIHTEINAAGIKKTFKDAFSMETKIQILEKSLIKHV